MEIKVGLITETFTQNEYKQQIKEEKTEYVYGIKKSIGSKEFFDAGQRGLKAEFVAEINAFEYNGEKTVEIGGHKYTVYRTYVNKNEKIELYLTERSGNG